MIKMLDLKLSFLHSFDSPFSKIKENNRKKCIFNGGFYQLVYYDFVMQNDTFMLLLNQSFGIFYNYSPGNKFQYSCQTWHLISTFVIYKVITRDKPVKSKFWHMAQNDRSWPFMTRKLVCLKFHGFVLVITIVILIIMTSETRIWNRISY